MRVVNDWNMNMETDGRIFQKRIQIRNVKCKTMKGQKLLLLYYEFNYSVLVES